MKRKILIVAVVMWIACFIGGGVWGRLEQFIRERSKPPDQAEVQKLEDLYDAKLFGEVLTECEAAEKNLCYHGDDRRILYIHWAASRQFGKVELMRQIEDTFLKRYPDDALVADMHFASAMDALAVTDYSGAKFELELIIRCFPRAAISRRANEILSHLHVPTTLPSIAKSQVNGTAAFFFHPPISRKNQFRNGSFVAVEIERWTCFCPVRSEMKFSGGFVCPKQEVASILNGTHTSCFA